jgi:hypothetical protein
MTEVELQTVIIQFLAASLRLAAEAVAVELLAVRVT